MEKYNNIVVGAGLTGLSMAAGLTRINEATVLIDRYDIFTPPTKPDNRTTFFLPKTIKYFENIGIWQDIADVSFPIRTITLIDEQGDKRDSPLTLPLSGDDYLGYNVPNHKFKKIITDHLKDKTIVPPPTPLTDLKSLNADLILACDGGSSKCRELSNIDCYSYNNDGWAIVMNAKHELSHSQECFEFQKKHGPLTFVPCQENHCAIVWMTNRNQKNQIMNEDSRTIAKMLNVQSLGMLGEIQVLSAPQSFPLHYQIAKRFYHNNIAFIGESAHHIPPIGAQGFNMCIQDCQEILDIKEKHVENIAQKYHAKRYIPCLTMAGGVMALDAISKSDNPVASFLRRTGMMTLNQTPNLQKKVLSYFSH